MSTDDLQGVPTDDLLIERRIELDLDADQLWELVATADGWQRWLVDGAEVDVRPGGAGVVIDGDVEREVHIATVHQGREMSFTWWERDDPASASEVSISIVPRHDGGAGLSIVERIPSARIRACASASSAVVESVRFAWEVRACILWAGSRSIVRV